jgi:5-deoxy-glucuronate isomerase
MRLADTLYRVPRRSGLHLIQKRSPGAARELTSWRLCLEAGDTDRYQSGDEESVLVLLQGSARLVCRDRGWTVSRSGIFEEPATALYLPPGEGVEVRAGTRLEAMIVSTPAGRGTEAALLPPEQIKLRLRGGEAFTREVHEILPQDSCSQRLIVGETRHEPGNWSSFPPHKHDGGDGEPAFEEIYYYRVEPRQGFGLQVVYAADGESAAHLVRDGDLVLLPYGYHPAAAPPGYSLYYLWVLAGDHRRLEWYEDPDHRWVGSDSRSSWLPEVD